MSCETCKHYKRPHRLGYGRIVGEKGKCSFGDVHRTVEPNEACCMDTSNHPQKLSK